MLVGQPLTEHRVATHIDREHPLSEAVRALVTQVPLDSHDWQTRPFAVILPGLSVLAACLLAELHGRCGHFPAVINLRPAADSDPGLTVFEVAELVNLQTIRDDSRRQRL